MHPRIKCILASISANFSPIFKIFFPLKAYDMKRAFLQKQAETGVLVVSVLQAPLKLIEILDEIHNQTAIC